VNNKEFLSDSSGYRRFLVLPIVKRNFDFLDFDINKIWSQAFGFYKSKGVITIDEVAINEINTINSHFEIFREEFELVQSVFEPPSNPNKVRKLNRAQIIGLLKTFFPGSSINPGYVTAALKKIGVEPIHTKRGNFYELQITADYEQRIQDILLNTKEGYVANF
jgi:hypothetical protein